MKYLVSIVVLLLHFSCSDSTPTTSPRTASTSGVSTVVIPFQNINVSQFKELKKQDDVIILDVRTPAEVAQGSIEGALNLDYKAPDFAERLQDLDKSKQYLVYCRSGGRSSNACQLLEKNGFTSFNLEGGYKLYSSQ